LGEIGRWSPDARKQKYACGFPGGKIIDGEWPNDAKTRIAHSDLDPFMKGLLWGEPKFHYEERASRSVGISTRYLRLLYEATFDENFDWQAQFTVVPQDVEKLKMRGSVKKRPVPKGQSGLVQRFAATQQQGAGYRLAPDIYVLTQQPPPGSEGYRPNSVELYAWLPHWEHDWLRTQDDAPRILRGWAGDLDEGVMAGTLAGNKRRAAAPTS